MDLCLLDPVHFTMEAQDELFNKTVEVFVGQHGLAHGYLRQIIIGIVVPAYNLGGRNLPNFRHSTLEFITLKEVTDDHLLSLYFINATTHPRYCILTISHNLHSHIFY